MTMPTSNPQERPTSPTHPNKPPTPPSSPLHHLAKLLRTLDFQTAITYLLSHPLLTTTPLPNGHTPLQFASLLGSTQLVQHLLNYTPPDAHSIVYAASNNHTAVLSLLLPHSPCPHSEPCLCHLHIPDAASALYTAAWHNHLATVQLILHKLCPRSLPPVLSHQHPNYKHRTALHAAALSGNFALVKALVEAGANANLRDDDGKSPCDWARRYAVASGRGEDVVEFLGEAELMYGRKMMSGQKKLGIKGASTCCLGSMEGNHVMPCVPRRVKRASSSPALRGGGMIGGGDGVGRRAG